MSEVPSASAVRADNAPRRVVHLVPPNGGGVDRFVRDLSARRPQDWLLHVSATQCVVECAADGLLVPVALAQLGALMDNGGLGQAALLHAHSTVAEIRHATQLLAAGMGLRYVVTLHDVEFAGAGGTTEPLEREQRIKFIRAAARCTAPSGFIRDLALDILGPAFDCTVVENGVDRLPPTAAVQDRPVMPIAVIGAMGKHKGLDHLIEVAAQLQADQRVVLLGYADGELGPGWLPGSTVWVHGAFEPAELPALVASYGSVLAFFPKGQPESYCYALSDAWLAGLPVVAPDSGAIGERVRAHGAGTLYEPDAPAAVVAQAISAALSRSATAGPGVQQAVRSLVSTQAMSDSMNKIYSAIAGPACAADLAALRRSAANHLDSRFFRRELLRLQGDLVAVGGQRDNALQELSSLAGNFAKRGEWIGQLQQTVEKLQEDCRALQQSGAGQAQELERLRPLLPELERLRAEHAVLQQSHGQLRASVERVLRPFRWPLRLLPAGARAWVAATAKRIFIEGRNG
jgi:glycosyltransferase involved in cell wall biosynthesis